MTHAKNRKFILMIILILLLLALFGCTSTQGKKIIVPGDQQWTDTGIDLRSGEQIIIDASGKVRASFLVRSGPNGVPDRPEWQIFNLVKGANNQALIGKIGETGEPFLLGNEANFQARRNGRLFLGVNDTEYANNSGKYTVTIQVLYSDIDFGIAGEIEEGSTVAQASPVPTLLEDQETAESTIISETELLDDLVTVEPTIVLNSEPSNGLLFQVLEEGESRVNYYGFSSSSETMQLTHITLDDDAGNHHTVIFNEDLVPVQWILPEMTIAAYNVDEGPFDLHNAYHIVSYGSQMKEVIVDIYPNDLGAVLDEMESITNESFDDARAFLEEYNINTYEALVGLAKQKGPEQSRFTAAAIGFSTSAAALSLVKTNIEEGSLQGQYRLAVFSISLSSSYMKEIVVDIAEQLLNYAGSEILDRTFALLWPHEPGMLLCKGASMIPQVCHYMFFHQDRGASPCIASCVASLDCYTDICMPFGGGMTPAEALKFCESQLR